MGLLVPLSVKKLNRCSNENGFTLIEALIGIGLLAVLIGTNMSMISSFFKMREQQIQKHDFYQSINSLANQISNRAVCNELMKSLTPQPFDVATLSTPLEIDEIKNPFQPLQPPLAKKNGWLFNNTTFIEKIRLKLAEGVPTHPNQRRTFLWLELDYYYGPATSAVKTGSVRATKSILYEVGLNPASPSGIPAAGTFVTGSCQDFMSKRDEQIRFTMCALLNSAINSNGRCDLMNNFEIRQTTCDMLGRPLIGRYCGP